MFHLRDWRLKTGKTLASGLYSIRQLKGSMYFVASGLCPRPLWPTAEGRRYDHGNAWFLVSDTPASVTSPLSERLPQYLRQFFLPRLPRIHRHASARHRLPREVIHLFLRQPDLAECPGQAQIVRERTNRVH